MVCTCTDLLGDYCCAIIPLVKNSVPPRLCIFQHPLQLNWSHAIIPGQSDVWIVIPTIFVLKHFKVSIPALDSHFTHPGAQREMCRNAEVNKALISESPHGGTSI